MRDDLEVCRAARVGGVILFDVDLPAFLRRREAGEEEGAARMAAVRNVVSPSQTGALSAALREALRPPGGLMVAVDQEGGRVVRFNPARGFAPTVSARELAAIDDAAWERSAAANASIVRGAGCDVNFTPCVDAAVNPANPIIARKDRSFGADVETVCACALEVIEAHTRLGVVTALKHFPGHGSSEGDTHLGFVDVTHTWRADPELAVYQRLVGKLDASRTMVMTGHLFHAGIDADHPASLSQAHTTGLLRETLGFRGVVVTDSLDMGAVTARYGVDEAVLLAVNAGADILLDAFNGPIAAEEVSRTCPAGRMHEAIARALRDGRIDGGEARLRESARRILGLRRWSAAAMMRG